MSAHRGAGRGGRAENRGSDVSVEIRCYGISAIVVRKATFRFEVLMLRRATTLKGEWCQVAGKIEPNETAWQAAVRGSEDHSGRIFFSYQSSA